MGKDGISDEKVMLALFILSSTVFFSSTYGIFTSNAGSQYSLVKALSEKQTFILGEYARYTGGIDYSKYGENYFSDRAPGVAFFAAPFYLFGKVASTVVSFPTHMGGWDGGLPAALSVLFFPIITGALSVALTFRLARLIGASQKAAIISAIAFGFGTIIWKYSGNLFSHSFNAFAVILAVVLAVEIRELNKNPRKTYLLAFILGFLPLIEYPNAILSIIILIYMYSKGSLKLSSASFTSPTVRNSIIVAAIPIIVLLSYNAVNFGSPFSTPYTYHQFEYSRDLSKALDVPWNIGVPGILFTSDKIDGGLFLISPFLILSLWGFTYLYKDKKSETILFLALFLAHLLFYSKHRTWFGGGVRDTRYIIHVVPK
jgi:hypothetical protein